jgi:hypothetical protein
MCVGCSPVRLSEIRIIIVDIFCIRRTVVELALGPTHLDLRTADPRIGPGSNKL